MRIVIATSSLTYCPDNYNPVLDYVLKHAGSNVYAVVEAKINPVNIAVKIPYLYLAGCTNMAKTLAGNILSRHTHGRGALAGRYNKKFLSVKDINSPQMVEWVRDNKIDLIINMRTRNIYSKEILNAPRFGCVNVHHGLLPGQKGLFCDLYAIADNIPTGFSIHKMTKNIDGGDVLYKEEVAPNKRYIHYLEAVAEKEGQAVSNFINKFSDNHNSIKKNSFEDLAQGTVTTTPNLKKIKQLQQKGIIL